VGLFEVLFIIKNSVIILWGAGMMVLVHTFTSVPEVLNMWPNLILEELLSRVFCQGFEGSIHFAVCDGNRQHMSTEGDKNAVKF
jgi:hypothetical protein